MSDFTSDFWHLYVAGLTLISILACLVLLWISGTTTVKNADDNTTGHVWDEDLREMNNPLPRWWVYLFVITVIFGLIYGALYPMFGNIQGKLGWSSHGQYDAEKQRNLDAIAPLYAAFAEMPHDKLAADSGAMAVGERLFMNYCAQCHGSDARGSRTFPNLTNGDWLWGGDIDSIKTSIAQGRMGIMPPMAAAVGDANQVHNLAHYVLSLSGSPHDSVKATLGRPSFSTCAACHGADGTGNTLMGAPNLTNNVWLHGWGVEAVTRAINHGITNVMPAQNVLLTDEQIHVLASYVWGMSNRPTPSN